MQLSVFSICRPYALVGNYVWVALNGFPLRVDRGEDGTIERMHGARGSATVERVGLWESTLPLQAVIALSDVFVITMLLGTMLLGM